MYVYLAMLALPSSLALLSPTRRRLALLIGALVYFVIIGFRFRVGMDWNNYVDIYHQKEGWSLAKVIVSREPGFGLLLWISARLGWGMIFVNAVSALVFCWGFFTVARRCREPWIGVTIATPLLAIAFAMSGVRQAIAAGIIFHLIAHWQDRRTVTRLVWVIFASAFHFSAVFMMIFVALGSNASMVVRTGSAILIGLGIMALVNISPSSVEAYSRLYIAGGKLTAPGAIFQIIPLAGAAIIYLTNRDRWARANGDTALNHGMAWAAIIAVPGILLSSVGAYRFGLYLWPMAMMVYSGVPGMTENGVGRLFIRVCIILAALAMLFGWLMLANNSYAWLPYDNWLLQPDGAVLWRSHYR
jgi:hypothetical protein